MKNEFLDYVEDIHDAMEKAEIVVSETDYETFSENFRVNFVVVRALEIIGEATKRLSVDIREQYPEITWKDMAGMRDRIIHGYDNVDLRIVWDTVKKEIPRIKPLIQDILKGKW